MWNKYFLILFTRFLFNPCGGRLYVNREAIILRGRYGAISPWTTAAPELRLPIRKWSEWSDRIISTDRDLLCQKKELKKYLEQVVWRMIQDCIVLSLVLAALAENVLQLFLDMDITNLVTGRFFAWVFPTKCWYLAYHHRIAHHKCHKNCQPRPIWLEAKPIRFDLSQIIPLGVYHSWTSNH